MLKRRKRLAAMLLAAAVCVAEVFAGGIVVSAAQNQGETDAECMEQAVDAEAEKKTETGMENCTGERADTLYDFIIVDGVLKGYRGDSAVVVIPDSVTTIGNGSFLDQTRVTSITIPSSVKTIECNAFCRCTGLTDVTISEGLTSIERFAFYGCSGLKSITLPKSVTNIGIGAFYECSGLKSIKVKEGNTVYDSREGCNAVIEKESNTLIAGCQNTVIPESVTGIGREAFYGCNGLTHITIPGNVVSIEMDAFYGCSGLTHITIPSSVKEISTSSFNNCSGLISITVEEGNQRYDSRGNCNAIITNYGQLVVGCQNTIIPQNVGTIGQAAFAGSIGLTHITIPSSVKYIQGGAFRDCSGLTHITIPSSVKDIDSDVFSGCIGLTSMTVEEGNTKYESRGNSNAVIEKESNILVAGCQNTVIPESVTGIGAGAFSDCSSLTHITIPESVVSIGIGAFRGCSGLKNITIPSSVTSIESSAFARSGLTSVTIPSSVKTIEKHTFAECNELAHITIPSNVVSIKGYAFNYCKNLTSIFIPESVTNMEEEIFYLRNRALTIYGKTGSCAETYAQKCNIKFRPLGAVTDKIISSSDVSMDTVSYIFDGTGKEPAVTVKYGEVALIKDTDYIVEYENNYGPGNAKAVVTGIGDYIGVVVKDFTITMGDTVGSEKKDISKCAVTISPVSYAYDGKAKTPAVTVKDGNTVLKKGTDYTVDYKNNKNAGTAKVIVTGKGNYKGIVGKTFTIKVKTGSTHTVGAFCYKVTGTSAVMFTKLNSKKTAKVKIPKTVKIGGKNFKVTAIGKNAFKNNKKITSVEIGDYVKTVGASAFEGCVKLAKVTVGKDVTEIGGSAFKNCRKLGTVTVKSTKLKKAGKNALKGLKATAKIKVPAKKLSAYKELFKNKGQGKKVKIVKL